MKTIIPVFLFMLICLMFSAEHAFGQILPSDLQRLDSTSVIQVKLKSGSEYSGRFVRQTSQRLVLKVPEIGEMSFLFSDLNSTTVEGYELNNRQGFAIPAMDSAQKVKIRLKDGSVLIGKLLSQSGSEIVVMTATTGKISVSPGQVISIDSAEGKTLADLTDRPVSPNPTRYFFSPSAFNLKKGEGYYQNVYVDVNLAAYGITDWFSIGGGLEVIGTMVSLAAGSWNPLWVLTPKIGFPIGKNFHLGAGFMGGVYKGYSLDNSGVSKSKAMLLGINYGVATYGDVDNNITLGVGLPFSTLNKTENSPIIVLNGMIRLGRKISLISENWIFTGQGQFIPVSSLFGYGVRLSGETMSFDIGFINNKDLAKYLIIGIPYIDFVYRFGRR
jgi:small nuclear ribonucleoprotein (snRNP)-like protein